MASRDSPNWMWERLGFTVNRDGFRRSVLDAHGRAVCEKAGYDTEQAIATWLVYGAII